MSQLRTFSLAIFCSVLLFAASPIASAQTTDPEAERSATQKRRDEIAAQLDVLKASDIELQKETVRLANVVKLHEQRAADARAALEQIEAGLGDLKRDVLEAERLAERRRRLARERAVAAYMRPSTESFTAVLSAEDYDEAHRRTTMLAEVAKHDYEVFKGRREADQQLKARRQALDDTLKQADELRRQAEDELAQARQARDEHARVQAALEVRIAEFQQEADNLAAYEGQLTALINQRRAVAPPVSSSTSTSSTPATTAAPGSSATSRPGAAVTQVPTTRTSQTPTTQTPTTRPPGGYTLRWPVSGVLTSPFGMRWGRMHQGIDIAAPSGTPIVAAAAGTVFFSGEMSGYGNVILIDHGNGLVTVYAHQSRLGVGEGVRVGAGQTIGYVGSTGHSTGPHLHFETRVNGTAVDPMRYLA
ncbi:MAG: peptidoglycan DD-metalloendopeptidase family protein [Acidimicrobiales bacterium]|nr:peptidoglycan DD-metalloendopeptidase family protein [Acidimicrobiales bacterium]